MHSKPDAFLENTTINIMTPTMMKSIKTLLITITLLALPLLLIACKSKPEKLETECEQLKKTAKITDDCKEMAKKLNSQLKSLAPQFQALKSMSDAPENVRNAYIRAVTPCSEYLLEIMTGTCKDHTEVINALQNFDNTINLRN